MIALLWANSGVWIVGLNLVIPSYSIVVIPTLGDSLSLFVGTPCQGGVEGYGNETDACRL